MGFDHRPLFGIQLPGLVKNRERNSRLADYVKYRRRAQSLHVPSRQTETQSKISRDSRHQEAMLIGSFVMPANRLEPARQPALSDVFANPAGCIFCTPDVDGLAAQYGGEHRSNGNRTGVRGLKGAV